MSVFLGRFLKEGLKKTEKKEVIYTVDIQIESSENFSSNIIFCN
jgi:hypothetical protein